MSNPIGQRFQELMTKVKQGDADAARQLIDHFEPEIRREIRIRLTDPRLRRVVDSMDICQSVMGNFFIHAVLGQMDVSHPNQLFRLLTTMATNKIIDRHRGETVRRESVRRRAILDYESGRQYDSRGEPVEKTPPIESELENEERILRVINLLTDEEKQIAAYRRDGVTWDEISKRLGSSSESLRKKLSRACARVLDQIENA